MLAPMTPVPIHPMRTSPGCMRAILAPRAEIVRSPIRRYPGHMLSDGTLVVDADSHWSERHDLFTELAPDEVQGPRAARRGDRRQAHVGVRRPPVGRASAGGVIGRDGQKESADHRAVTSGRIEDVARRARTTPKVRLEVLDECGIDAQVIFPSTSGLGGQDLGMVDDEALCQLVDRDLQRRHGRDPGRLRQPAPAAAADAGVGRRLVRRRGQARRGARRARRQHDLRPAGPRRARPRQPRRGTRSGRCAPTSTCRCTSTSAPASPR